MVINSSWKGRMQEASLVCQRYTFMEHKHGIELLKKVEMKYCILDCITDLLFFFSDFNVVLFSRSLSLCCSSCLIFLSHRKSANETMIF